MLTKKSCGKTIKLTYHLNGKYSIHGDNFICDHIIKGLKSSPNFIVKSSIEEKGIQILNIQKKTKEIPDNIVLLIKELIDLFSQNNVLNKVFIN